jgi:ABC-type polysaccharide/polyol phosphate transport system ATPase subunit
MTANAIEVRKVSKRYLLGEHHGSHGSLLSESLAAYSRRIFRREPARPHREIWSLRDIDLDVRKGDTLGIIGRNGAGKTTLLKIITRITEPTAGVCRTRGQVGALLEVGTGFHPELTGRENVYLNGAILGMRRRVVDRKLDEIVEFAGVGPFMDTPVKRFSSGMYLRLAFAIAAYLEADVLAVDEVLAVGDAEFQRRCLGKMESMHGEGRTVVFVSHNLDAITWLCPRAVWLDHGEIKASGPTPEVVAAYLASGEMLASHRTFPDDPTKPVCVLSATVLDADGNPADALARDAPLTFEVRFVVRERVPGLDMTVFVHNLRGVRVLEEAWSETTPSTRREALGEYTARIVIPPILVAGDYIAGFWLGSVYEPSFYEDDVLRFLLRGDVKGRPNRVAQLGVPWDVRPVSVRP